MKITYYFEILSFISGILSLILIIRRNPTYLPNKLIGIGLFLVGCHPFSIFIYDVIATDLSVQIFLRIAIMSSLFGITLIFFTMKCMVKSVEVFKRKSEWLPFIILDGIILLYFIFTDFIEFEEAIHGNVNISMELIPLAVDIIAVLFYLFYSAFNLYFKGIKKVSDPFHKKRMIWFLIGLLISLIGIFATIGSQIVEDQEIGVILDITFLLALSVSSLVMMISFLLKKGEISSNNSSSSVEEAKKN